MHDRPVRVAIAGTGAIANIHAEHLARLDGAAEIVAAVDVVPERVDAFADAWRVSRRYTKFGDLLRDGNCDLVHLCSPPLAHREQAIAALERGLPVLAEKPPALSLAEFDEIAAAEAAGDGFFATVSQHRFGGRAIGLREAIARNEFGRLHLALCNTLWFRPDDYFAADWRGRWESEGGGPTMGHGIHQMDLMLSLAGPWTSVRATAKRQARPTDTEDLSVATVELASGAVLLIVNSLLSPRETSYLRFDFEQATIELEHLYGYTDGAWRCTLAPHAADSANAAWEATATGRDSGHAAQFEQVISALRNGSSPPVTTVDARRTLELIAAVYASAFTGEEIKAGEIGPDSPFYRTMSGHRVPWPPGKGAR